MYVPVTYMIVDKADEDNSEAICLLIAEQYRVPGISACFVKSILIRMEVLSLVCR
jgi:hypothetical protein